MTTYGYARVSTDGQTLQAQTEALHGAGCARIFAEKISGAYSNRPQLAKTIAALSEGDTLVEIAKSFNVSHMTIARLSE